MMPRKSLLAVICLASVTGFSSVVLSDEGLSARAGTIQVAVTQTSEQPDMIRASKLIGQTVRNGKGEEIGSVDDLVLDQGDRILYAVVSVGGFLGVGDRLVAVPFEELKFGSKDVDGVIIYGMSKEKLKAVPVFTYSEATEGTSRERFMQSAGRRVDLWNDRIDAGLNNATDMKEGASEKVDTAWKKVQVQWQKLKDVSADAWQSAKQKFDDAMSDLQRAWNEATS